MRGPNTNEGTDLVLLSDMETFQCLSRFWKVIQLICRWFANVLVVRRNRSGYCQFNARAWWRMLWLQFIFQVIVQNGILFCKLSNLVAQKIDFQAIRRFYQSSGNAGKPSEFCFFKSFYFQIPSCLCSGTCWPSSFEPCSQTFWYAGFFRFTVMARYAELDGAVALQDASLMPHFLVGLSWRLVVGPRDG